MELSELPLLTNLRSGLGRPSAPNVYLEKARHDEGKQKV